ncbi:DNA-binding CsgD family transcriptional regulator [Geodermatophilus bullaregiensis]|uniref:ATP-binding protein n=1 Tax=Geodermatophilus bullaregiensis TaxID=1564160 RepID=UPI001956ABCF|nr:helix-turn-helix transcriptional regulator [Geodermatophilus bullaregiensis]MBM7808250.1 DNA-binding CsgD family transcriptional regulator [Geodermatophilus bullaregiensis]
MLAGRDRERAAIAALVDAARAGRGGALVLTGPPGVGKSALLADALARAEGMTVLRTQGLESESPLAFAALQRLLRPVLADCVQHLPQPQARALRAALGETDDGPGDRFLVFLAALSVLADAGQHRPVLAVVDDAHWLDDASAAALLFVARRLQVERVALLFAARDADVRTFDSGDLPRLVVGGLDADAAGQLLSARAAVAVPPDVRDALLASTGGSPLALVELAEVLTPEQLSGRVRLPDRLPLTEGVERAFLDRYRRLPGPARTVLLVAAADDSGRARVVRQAATSLGADEEALATAERSGLLRVREAAVDLRHPLVRSAVYGAATSTERRQAHRALAAALSGPGEADRRAWHLAASVLEPDEAVVAELDAAAERARARGGLEAAASAWERAAELSPAGDAQAGRLYAAARAAWLAAQPVRARALVDAAAAQAGDPLLRSDVLRLRARIEWNTGSLDTGRRMVLEAAAEVAPHDSQRAREMAMFAVALEAFGAHRTGTADPTALVPPPGPGAPLRARCFSDLLYGLDAAVRGDWTAAVPPLAEAFTLAEDLAEEDLDLLPNLGIAALHLGDDARTRHYHEQLLARARSTGAVLMILYSLTRVGFAELATGRWTAARAAAAEALPLADHSGHRGLAALPTAWLALLAALRGDETVEQHLADAERICTDHPLGILAEVVPDVLQWARGVRDAADPPAALHRLEQIRSPITRRLAATERIEAAVRAGRPELAGDWVAELAAFADATGSAWAQAGAEHGRALLGEGPEAAGHFERALAAHAVTDRRPDRARTQLAYGAFLRRSRRRVDARAHLRAALETFEDLGARPWADRARQELRASGETARRRDPSTVVDLTPQELQVARLVRRGLPNRDVAAQLYVSPRTVDFHLRNVFAKLGVSSRTELAATALD